MATKPASTASPEPPGPGATGGPGRQLWQAPVFVAGVLAVVGVCLARPLVAPDPRRQLEHDLQEARRLLARPDGDPAQAVEVARRALDAAEAFPDRGGEAALLLGTAYLRLAERVGHGAASEHWQNARQFLEDAERRGVPESQRGQLQCRLGRLGFYLNDDPARVVTRLAAGVELLDVEEKGEAYMVLTQAYLRLGGQINVQKALEVNKKLRNLYPVSEEVLAEARLLGGELALRLHNPAEARLTLSHVGNQAPPRVLARAQVLRARLYEEQDNKWQEAADLFDKALASAQPIPDRPQVLYHYGLCCQHLGQADKASAAWEECLRLSQGEEGPAAALGLASLRLQDANPEAALPSLAQAVQGVRISTDWNNSLFDLAHARDVFEQAATVFRKAGRPELVLRLVDPYRKLAAPGRAAVLQAEAAVARAGQRQEKARQAASNEEQAAEEVAARGLLARAGAAYEQAAEAARLDADRAEYLWQSSAQYFQCQEYARAAEQLTRFLPLDPTSGRQGEGLFLLGECYRQLNDPAAQEAAYRRCLACPASPYVFRARYELALMAITRGDPTKAKDELERNVRELGRVQPEGEGKAALYEEVKTKSLVALSNLLYHWREYREVVRVLEGGLRPAHNTPVGLAAGPDITRARYQLADSYVQLAAKENQRLFTGERMSDETRRHYEAQRNRWLKKAIDEFEWLGEYLQRPETEGHLSAKEVVQIPFTIARCWYDLGKYNEAKKIYEELADKLANRPDGIDALVGCVKCFAALEDAVQMRRRLESIRLALPCLEDPEARKQIGAWVDQCFAVLNAKGQGPSGGAEHREPVMDHREPIIIQGREPAGGSAIPSAERVVPGGGPSAPREPGALNLDGPHRE